MCIELSTLLSAKTTVDRVGLLFMEKLSSCSKAIRLSMLIWLSLRSRCVRLSRPPRSVPS